MASILLASAGSTLGGAIGGSILGVGAATIGGAIGSFAGSMIDSWIVSSLAPGQRIEGARLENLTVTTSTEGAVIPRLYGRMRIGGNIIWATDFTETVNTTTQGGGKGGGGGVTTTAYLYTASFAVALCEGPISGIGRIWADGKPLDLKDLTWRTYNGDKAQQPDPFITAKMGAGNTPAYRGTAYVMFEELPLEQFGNRIPQLSFEVFRSLSDPDTVESLVKAVTLTPGSGEFVYATEPIRQGTSGATTPENIHANTEVTNMVISLDRLETALPNVESVSLVASWFGTDLNAGNCQIKPGVENATKITSPKSWSVIGVSRASAYVVSQDTEGRPAYGGTPADFAIVQAIKELKARGKRVTFYPFLLMDIPVGNTLPDPYSDNAVTIGQPNYPWRGRITCSPAAGFTGTVDKTTAATSQVAAFFGNAQASDFSVAGEVVSWTGDPNDWGYRRMILHYAHLCAAAGGVDAFLIGSELRGLTTIRDGTTSYPAIAALKQLAADVANLVTISTGLYPIPVDFTELTLVPYPGDTPAGVMESTALSWENWKSPLPAATAGTLDTSGTNNRTVYKCIDVIAAGVSAADIDAGNVTLEFSATQNWIWGGTRLQLRAFGLPDTAGTPDISFPHAFNPLFLDAAANASVSVPIATTSGSGVLPAGTRWIQLQIIMFDGLLASGFDILLTSGTPKILSGSVGYAADWSEYFGHQPDDGTGDVLFHLDPLWSDPNIHFIGIDNYLPLSDWRDGMDHLDAQAGWTSIHDLNYLRAGIEGGEGFDWFYASDTDRIAQVRTPINDGAYGKPWVFRPKDIRNWWSNQHFDRPSGVENPTATTWVPRSKPIRFTEIGCPAVDRGTNQPNVFLDPKSFESALPYFSRGWQDEAIQRRYIEAMLGYWGEAANNPVSIVYPGSMVDMAETAVWTWDARPYPDFPARVDVWADAPNWRLGHWLNGRAGAVGLGALVRELCGRAGLEAALIDVSELADIVQGFAITALESPRASISVLARHFGFDAVESGGVIRFVMRGQRTVATIAPDDMVAGASDVMELTRGQETELPQALKWQVIRADEEYDAATVEARRVTVSAARVSSETFPLAVPLEEADRRCRRALMEAWVGRETLTAKLPPSRLSLDPGDVVSLDHDGRLVNYRLERVSDAGARSIEAIRTDAAIYDLPPGQFRSANLPGTIVYGPAEVALLNLPQISEAVPAHQPYAAVFANPWYGSVAIWSSSSQAGFVLRDIVGQAAQMGVLVADLSAGPLWRFDQGNELLVDMSSGTLTSVTDAELLAGANSLAVESSPGVWEVLQAGTAELVSSGLYRLYRLTRLLRGQHGTEDAMGNPTPAGARIIVLNSALQPLSISEADLGLPWNWRVGPASAAPSDALMTALTFTPEGRGLKPFAPAQLRMRREANGDLSLRWIRRSRALSADSWVLAEAPLVEASETYDLEILDGITVVRTVSGLTVSAFTYANAMQTADYGGPVSSLTLRVFQLGALGRGVPLTQTLSIKESL
jgi:Gene Transfer Agent (GTA)-like protein/putative tail protein